MQKPAARLANAWWSPPPRDEGLVGPALPDRHRALDRGAADARPRPRACPRRPACRPRPRAPTARLPGGGEGGVLAVAPHRGDVGRGVDALDLARRSPAAGAMVLDVGVLDAGRSRGSGRPRAGAAAASSGGRRRGRRPGRRGVDEGGARHAAEPTCNAGSAARSGGGDHGPGRDPPAGDEPRGDVGVGVGERLDLLGRTRRVKTKAAPVGGSPSAPGHQSARRPSHARRGEVGLAVGRPPLDDVGDVVVEQEQVGSGATSASGRSRSV